MSLIAKLAIVALCLVLPARAYAQDDGDVWVPTGVLAAAIVAVTAVEGLEAADDAGKEHLAWPKRGVADGLSYGAVAGALLLPCVSDRSTACLKREGVRVGTAIAITEMVKRLVDRERPDGSDARSFFSEHTTLACVGGLTSTRQALGIALCAGTAYLRVAAKRHFVSDVLTGVGVGFALSRIAR